MRSLLDTNIVSDLIRNPQGRVAGTYKRNWRTERLYRHHRRCETAIWRHQESFATAHETGRSGAIVLARDSPLARCLVAPLTSLATAALRL